MNQKKKPPTEHRTAIIVAIITLTGVLGAALFANWDKIFPEKSPPSTVATPDVRANTSPNPKVSPDDELVVNFSSLNTADAPGHYVAADPYLLDHKISVEDRVPPKSLMVIKNNLALYAGRSVRPGKSQNFLTQTDTDNGPASFKLVFKHPCQSISFTRPELLAATKSGITHPAWSAHALDLDGHELSSQSEGVTKSLSNVPARTYVLTAPGFAGIAAIRFDADPRVDGKPFAAFPAMLLEELRMKSCQAN